MPIDKIIPSYLNKSDDERLIKKNEMTEAKNVTVSTDTDGNAFVLKNAKGTTAVLKNSASDLIDTDYLVLGSCVDQEDEMVYFAAYDDAGSDHAIFRVDMSASTPTYEEVFASQYLFDSKPEYVDMDVLRADVNQSGTIVPILYFTDGISNPKKINVNRAMDSSDAGGYSSADDIKEFIDVAKTKPVHQFFIECGTDVDFDGNFLYGRNLSFCIQWVYKDGEHSAISNISEMAIPQVTFQNEEDGRKPVAGNFFYFNVPVGTQEVKEVNVLYRDNETGVYYMADRILKVSDVTRSGHTIWDDSLSRYYFYGDQDHEVVPNIEALKIYDNVPLKAKTQAIVDGRIMYGNYTEGREVPALEVTFEPKLNARYASNINTHSYDTEQSNEFSFPAILGFEYETTNIELDLTALQGTCYSGDSMYMDFVVSYDTLFGIRTGGSHFLSATTPGSTTWSCGASSTYPMIFDDFEFRFKMEYRVDGSSQSKNTFLTNLATAISGHETTTYYRNDNNSDTSWERTSGSQGNATENVAITKADVTVKFSASVSGNKVIIKPMFKTMENVEDDGFTIPGNFNPVAAGANITDCQTGGRGSNPTVEVTDIASTVQAKDFYSYRTYKAGANHTFGAIFYDKKGRSSFVRELGSVYIPTLGERAPSERGLARVNASFNRINASDQTVPSWVEKIQFVYGGSDIEDFKQYSVSGGFASYWADSEYTTTDESEDAADNIYVSLKGWSGSKQSYTGSNGADYVYNFKEGDILRVISYDKKNGTGVETVYPEKLEFSVVGKRTLREDITDSNMEVIRAQIEQASANREESSDASYWEEILSFYTGGVFGQSDRKALEEAEQMFQNVMERVETSKREEIERIKNIPLSKRNDVFPGDWAVAKGDFLVLKHNGSAGWGPSDHKHVKFNNGALAIEPTPTHDGDENTGDHWHPIGNWMRNVVVEIYTPKQKTKAKVYKELTKIYERGDGGAFNSDGTLSVTQEELRSGDTWFKRVPLATLSKNNTSYSTDLTEAGSNFNYTKINEMTFEMTWLESPHASHFFKSHRHAFGKPHFVNKYAASNNRAYSITYSDKYNSDSPILNLSNFNLGRANYIDLPSSYSQIDRIISNEGDLTVIQGSKVCRIPIGKSALKLANQQDVLTTSDVVLGKPSYYVGDYGTRGLSQAVVAHNGSVYFADYVSRSVLRVGRDGMTDISAIGMDSFFEKNFGDWAALSTRSRLHLGYDPDYNEVLVFAGQDSSESFDGFCAAYNVQLKKWTSTYEFIGDDGAEPTLFEMIGDKLISCADSAINEASDQERTLIHIHDDSSAQKAKFYGDIKDSVIEVVSNMNPSMVKVFEAVALEGDGEGFSATITTSDQNTDISRTDWEERERGYYAMMPRDKSSNSTSHKIAIGSSFLSVSAGGGTITFNNKISRIGIPHGAKLYNETKDKVITDDGTADGTSVTVTSVDGKVLGFTPSLTASNVVDSGDVITVLLEQRVYGDAIRDYFCKIKLMNQNSDGDSFELFSINTHYDRSKLGAEKG